jgi:hypothetical protein
MDLTPFINAIKAHQWVLFGALIIFFLVGLTKQGWFSAWLAVRLPSRFLPYYALVISCLTLGSSEVIAGKGWQTALSDCFMAVVAAIVTHQITIEGWRGGKEIVPATKRMMLVRGV